MENNVNPVAHILKTLSRMGKQHPDTWSLIDKVRASKGQKVEGQAEVFDWPEWCFLPLAFFRYIVTYQNHLPSDASLSNDLATVVDVLSVLGTWRITQGVYRFDNDVYNAIIDTPFDGKLPTNIFFRLPEWCIYIETPGLLTPYGKQLGAFVHLDYHMLNKKPQLIINIDLGDKLKEYAINIDDYTLMEAIEEQVNTELHTRITTLSTKEIKIDRGFQCIKPILSLLLYICSQNADFGDKKPTLPEAKKTKKGARFFSPPQPVVWDVGIRLGAAIRSYHINGSVAHDRARNSPRPHIRRAHWSSFWTGKRDSQERKIIIKWIPPIPVNAEGGNVIPTIHRVESVAHAINQ